MIYLSIDIETTGIDRDDKGNALTIEFAAILEDTDTVLPYDQLPKFERRIAYPDQPLVGEPYAMAKMPRNVETIALLADRGNLVNAEERQEFDEENGVCVFWEFAHQFRDWLIDIGYLDVTARLGNEKKSWLTVAGKNFIGFDLRFLKKLPNWSKFFDVRSRVLDPAIMFVDWKSDNAPPSLDKCKQRCGISGVVTHKAIDDAWDVVRLLRADYAPHSLQGGLQSSEF
tara:strand:- start:140 stop:823 length:684 start_codon:yes stop_codon:yes gene_type:complete